MESSALLTAGQVQLHGHVPNEAHGLQPAGEQACATPLPLPLTQVLAHQDMGVSAQTKSPSRYQSKVGNIHSAQVIPILWGRGDGEV